MCSMSKIRIVESEDGATKVSVEDLTILHS